MKDRSQFEPRKRARRRVLQALYQWKITGQDERDIAHQFLEEQDFRKVDKAWFREQLSGVVASYPELDEYLQPFIDRPLSQLDIIELMILRMSAFELRNHPEIPKTVVMNEAIDLARRFGAEQGHSFVNGVLDKAARQAEPGDDSGSD